MDDFLVRILGAVNYIRTCRLCSSSQIKAMWKNTPSNRDRTDAVKTFAIQLAETGERDLFQAKVLSSLKRPAPNLEML